MHALPSLSNHFISHNRYFYETFNFSFIGWFHMYKISLSAQTTGSIFFFLCSDVGNVNVRFLKNTYLTVSIAVVKEKEEGREGERKRF